MKGSPHSSAPHYAPTRLQQPDFGGLDVALVGVPMDLGVTNRPGARFGPRAVRGVERIGPYHHVHRFLPLSAVKAGDVGDVPFRSRYSLDDSIEDIETLFTKHCRCGSHAARRRRRPFDQLSRS